MDSNCIRCGHLRSQHIYEEGACRPGFFCDCQQFISKESIDNNVMDRLKAEIASNEQLRAQLAERDKYLDRYREQTAQSIVVMNKAQETIADFRSALKEIREGNALMAEGEGSDPQVYMDMAKHWMKEADKALQKHPDSTEVKG